VLTNKLTPLKTSTSLRYATPVGSKKDLNIENVYKLCKYKGKAGELYFNTVIKEKLT